MKTCHAAVINQERSPHREPDTQKYSLSGDGLYRCGRPTSNTDMIFYCYQPDNAMEGCHIKPVFSECLTKMKFTAILNFVLCQYQDIKLCFASYCQY